MQKNESDSLDDKISAFEKNLLDNLQRNGFPEKAVAFPIDSIFEAAAKKGFSFNKVRDQLTASGIEVVLEETRIVFSKSHATRINENRDPAEALVDEQGQPEKGATFNDVAREILEDISPAQMQSFKDLLNGLGASKIDELKKQLDSMSEHEKTEMVSKLKNVKNLFS